MLSFLFKRKSSELITSSENTVSISSLIAQINNLKEENERFYLNFPLINGKFSYFLLFLRKRLQIEALEKQVNQQQIQILTLRKCLRFISLKFMFNQFSRVLEKIQWKTRNYQQETLLCSRILEII